MTNAERIEGLRGLGYSEREAGFLTLAALHSGYFLRRQYETFISAARGAAGTRFLRKVASAGHVRPTLYANRTEVFHLFARSLYGTIGEQDNRNRRRRPPLSIKAKLMALDYVLAHRSRHFLSTESEKLELFNHRLGIGLSRLPGKTYRSDSSSDQTRRYFIEKHPIFMAQANGSPSPVVSFCYVDEGVLSTAGFASFLERYRPLLAALDCFRLVYIAAAHHPFFGAERKFSSFLDALASPELTPSGALGEYFRLRHLFETRQYGSLDKAKLDRLRELSAAFRQAGTDEAFRHWAEDIHMAEGVGKTGACFEPYRLAHNYDIFGSRTPQKRTQSGTPNCTRCSASEQD